MTLQFTSITNKKLSIGSAESLHEEKNLNDEERRTHEEQRKNDIAERKKWLVDNFKELGDQKFLVLMKLVSYAEDHLVVLGKTKHKRIDTFNRIFNEAVISQEPRQFLQTVIDEKKKIAEAGSSLCVALSTAEKQLDTLLDPVRRVLDLSSLLMVAYTTSSFNLLPWLALGTVYYGGREVALNYAFPVVSPAIEKVSPYYHKVKNPITNAISSGLHYFQAKKPEKAVATNDVGKSVDNAIKAKAN